MEVSDSGRYGTIAVTGTVLGQDEEANPSSSWMYTWKSLFGADTIF